MSKKKNKKQVITGLEITEMRLHYMSDGFSCGYGKHKNKKAYTRKAKHPHKVEW